MLRPWPTAAAARRRCRYFFYLTSYPPVDQRPSTCVHLRARACLRVCSRVVCVCARCVLASRVCVHAVCCSCVLISLLGPAFSLFFSAWPCVFSDCVCVRCARPRVCVRSCVYGVCMRVWCVCVPARVKGFMCVCPFLILLLTAACVNDVCAFGRE